MALYTPANPPRTRRTRADTLAETFEKVERDINTYGRPDRFTHYKSIPTLRENLLVAQHRPHVTRLYKQDDGKWIHTEANELDATLTLDSLGCDLPLVEIYQGVGFDSPATI